MGSLVRVKFAGSTSRPPTVDEIRAGVSDTDAPFTATFSALTIGQTIYVGALGYDANGQESTPVYSQITAGGPVGSTSPAVPWLFLKSGTNMYQGVDGDPTTLGSASGVGDKIAHWTDANGNGRQATGILDAFSHFSLVPTRSGNAANLNDGYLQLPDMSGFTAGVIMARLKATSSAVTNKLWIMNRSAFQAGNVALYPDSADGHIKDSWGTTARTDFGDPGVSLSSAYHTYEVHSDSGTRLAKLDGTTLPTTDSPPASGVWFNSTPRLSGSINTEVFAGLCDGLVVFDAVPSETQLAQWRGYFDGSSPNPPGTLDTPTLAYAFSGGDVVVTVAAPYADSGKIDASTSSTPTATNVRATSSLTTLPFSKTFTAPTGGQVLHVAAFAYLGSTESPEATLDISPEVTAADAAALSAFTPTRIPSGETFTAPADKQVLFYLPITVEGSLVVAGALVEIAS